MTNKSYTDSAVGTTASWSHNQTELKADIMHQTTLLIGPDAARATFERMNHLERMHQKVVALRIGANNMTPDWYLRELEKLRSEFTSI